MRAISQLLPARWSALAGWIIPLSICGSAWAHCDGLDGPVVLAAKKALESGNVNYALIWVQPKDEAAVTRVFQDSLAGRNASPDEQARVEERFFETLVRVHRQGEGAVFTGLKPAGRDLGPAIPAADSALETGSIDAVNRMLDSQMQQGLEERFNDVMAKRKFDPNDVEAGRAYVAAYVRYVHFVEGIYQATQAPAHGHFAEVAETADPHLGHTTQVH